MLKMLIYSTICRENYYCFKNVKSIRHYYSNILNILLQYYDVEKDFNIKYQHKKTIDGL